MTLFCVMTERKDIIREFGKAVDCLAKNRSSEVRKDLAFATYSRFATMGAQSTTINRRTIASYRTG